MTEPDFIERVQDVDGRIESTESIDDLWRTFGTGVDRGDKQGLVDAMLEDYGGTIPPADMRVLAAAGYPIVDAATA